MAWSPPPIETGAAHPPSAAPAMQVDRVPGRRGGVATGLVIAAAILSVVAVAVVGCDDVPPRPRPVPTASGAAVTVLDASGLPVRGSLAPGRYALPNPFLDPQGRRASPGARTTDASS